MLNLHECFQIKTVKVLLYFPGSLMFRNKHWQCLFRAFQGLSAHVSSTLSLRLVELAILPGDSKVQAWKLYFLKKEIRQSAAWDTCSSCLLQPRRPDGSWGQPGAEPGAGCGTASPGSWPADKCCSTRALSSLPVFSQPLPPQLSSISSPFVAHLIVSCFSLWKVFFPHLAQSYV